MYATLTMSAGPKYDTKFRKKLLDSYCRRFSSCVMDATGTDGFGSLHRFLRTIMHANLVWSNKARLTESSLAREMFVALRLHFHKPSSYVCSHGCGTLTNSADRD